PLLPPMLPAPPPPSGPALFFVPHARTKTNSPNENRIEKRYHIGGSADRALGLRRRARETRRPGPAASSPGSAAGRHPSTAAPTCASPASAQRGSATACCCSTG